MNVYVVSTGSYSDYDIKGIFLDEKKATKYANAIHGDVELFETKDDKVEVALSEMKEYTTVTVNFSRESRINSKIHFEDIASWIQNGGDLLSYKSQPVSTDRLSFNLNQRNTFYDDMYKTKPRTSTSVSFEKIEYSSNDYYSLSFYRHFDKKIEADRKELQKKYYKIVQDIFNECLSLLYNEEWTVEMINEWLKDKYSFDELFKL